ncbi:MAG: hypothetical protein AAB368_13140, partial [bacterium]
MKIAFLSKGNVHPYAWQLREAGAVTSNESNVKRGGVPDAVVLEGAGWGAESDRLRAEGVRVLCGGKWAELMSADAGYHKAQCERAGLRLDARPAPKRLAVYGGWWERGWTGLFYAGTVYNRLFSGDAGPACGPVGAALTRAEPDPVVTGLEAILRPADYAGPVTLVMDPEDYAFLGVALGLQPQIVEALSELVYGGLAALLTQATPTLSGDAAVSLLASLPPWPYSAAPAGAAFTVEAGLRKHFWPVDAEETPEGFVTTGASGAVASISAR